MYKAIFDRERQFGIEIEFFGVDRYKLVYMLKEREINSDISLFEGINSEFWTLTEDASIEAEEGIELRSPILKGTSGLQEVKKVLTLLNDLEAQVNDSCGLHVHWSGTDYTAKNLLALLRLYAKFELVIDNLVSPNRRDDKNIHCRSLVKDEDLAWINTMNHREEARAIGIVTKYVETYRTRQDKINITSYAKFGTLEFRHHESTLQIDDALNWIIFTQMFVTRAKNSPVSREMSVNPVLPELIRVLGMADFQGSTDPLILETRAWLKKTYKNSLKQEKELVTA